MRVVAGQQTRSGGEFEALEHSFAMPSATYPDGHPSQASLQNRNWLIAHEAFPEIVAESRRRLGRLALSGQVEVEPVKNLEIGKTTLLANMRNAALGDEDAYQTVLTNVKTDMAERVYKSGHISEVELDIRNDALLQHGSQLIDIYTNALRYMQLDEVMAPRTWLELENAHIMEELNRAKVLDTHNAVVFQLCPRKKSTIKDYNFFGDTASCSVQHFEKKSEAKAVIQTALVAGKVALNEPRHDKVAVEKLIEHASNENEVRLDDDNDSLRYILLVPKEENPDGIIDIVRWYDEAVGPGIFYGGRAPKSSIDYMGHQRLCRDRARLIKQLASSVARQLIDEVHSIDRPLAALKRLNDLSEAALVRAASEAFDLDIDESVFGNPAARRIQESRELRLAGDAGGATRATEEAIRIADSSSCPMNFSGSNKEGDEQQTSALDSVSRKKFMRCPFCRATQFGDPCANRIACNNCNAEVNNGKVTDRGNGGKSTKRKPKRTSGWW